MTEVSSEKPIRESHPDLKSEIERLLSSASDENQLREGLTDIYKNFGTPEDQIPEEVMQFMKGEAFKVIQIGVSSAIRNLNLKVEYAQDTPSGLEEPSTFVDQQYSEALSTAQMFEVDSELGDIPLPDVDAVKRAVLASVTSVQWEEIRNFREPTLQLVPVANLSRFKQAINSPACREPSNANEAAFLDFPEKSFALEADRIKKSELPQEDVQRFKIGKVLKWRFCITDGATEMTDQGEWNERTWKRNDEEYVPTNRERIESFRAHFGPKNMSGLEYADYILLQMRKMKNGEPVDAETYTLLPEIHRWDQVADGAWRSDLRYVYLDSVILDLQYEYTRVRAAVRGDIEN